MNKINVEITTINGIKKVILLNPTITVDDLKTMISKEISIEKELIHLIFKGTSLQNEKTLQDYNIQDGSSITFIRLKKSKQIKQSKQPQKQEEHNQNEEDEEEYWESSSNGMSEDFLDLSFGDDSFEEMLDEIEMENPELAQQLRENPGLFATMVQDEIAEMVNEIKMEEDEMNNYRDQMEELEIEEKIIESIRSKIADGNELTPLENAIIEEDDEMKAKLLIIKYTLLQEEYPERLIDEALKNTSTLKDARNYCQEYLN